MLDKSPITFVRCVLSWSELCIATLFMGNSFPCKHSYFWLYQQDSWCIKQGACSHIICCIEALYIWKMGLTSRLRDLTRRNTSHILLWDTDVNPWFLVNYAWEKLRKVEKLWQHQWIKTNNSVFQKCVSTSNQL